jgi:hypothetical protein
MKCKQAQSHIALWVGHDLVETDLKELQPHLAECAACGSYWLQMKESMDVLQHLNADIEKPKNDSLWPQLSARIEARRHLPPVRRSNGTITVLTLMAAMLMIALFSRSFTQQPPTDMYRFSQEVHPSTLPNSFVKFYSDSSWEKLPDIEDEAAILQPEDDTRRFSNVVW